MDTLLAAIGTSQTQTYIAYPSDTTINSGGNNAPLGRNGNGLTDEARAQIVIPAAFLPPTGGVVVAIEAAPKVNTTLTYASLDIQAANMPSTVPFPTLNPVFAINLGAAPVTVFSQQNHTITWPALNWTRITFSTPFVHLPGHHLVLDFQKAVACPAASGLGHVTANTERTLPGSTFDLPVMMVSFGACGSNAHMATANTSTGGRRPPRLRVVYLAVPTLVADSGVAPNLYWAVGNSFTLTTHADVGSWAVQLVDLVGPPLSANTTPLVIPGVLGHGWVLPGPALISVGTGVFTTTSHTTTLTVPNNTSFAGIHMVFQSLLLHGTSLTPTWTNATDATLR